MHDNAKKIDNRLLHISFLYNDGNRVLDMYQKVLKN